jgi:hypothetical protein
VAGDHERRVGGDEVVRLARHRLPQRALAQLESDPVEGGVEGGDAQRPLVDVGRDDLIGVGGQVQRLDAAARAEVEGPDGPVADGELGQRRGGRADAEHVVGRHPNQLSVETGCQVADHPPVVVVVGVGPAVEQGSHLAAGADQHAAGDQRVDQAGQGTIGVGTVDVGLQQEEPGQGRQR